MTDHFSAHTKRQTRSPRPLASRTRFGAGHSLFHEDLTIWQSAMCVGADPCQLDAGRKHLHPDDPGCTRLNSKLQLYCHKVDIQPICVLRSVSNSQSRTQAQGGRQAAACTNLLEPPSGWLRLDRRKNPGVHSGNLQSIDPTAIS